jgi:hypothetical protein
MIVKRGYVYHGRISDLEWVPVRVLEPIPIHWGIRYLVQCLDKKSGQAILNREDIQPATWAECSFGNYNQEG